MKKKLIYLNLLLANFFIYYAAIRITGDTALNQFLDTLIDFVVNNVEIIIWFILGVFVPLDKAKEMLAAFKK